MDKDLDETDIKSLEIYFEQEEYILGLRRLSRITEVLKDKGVLNRKAIVLDLKRAILVQAVYLETHFGYTHSQIVDSLDLVDELLSQICNDVHLVNKVTTRTLVGHVVNELNDFLGISNVPWFIKGIQKHIKSRSTSRTENR